MPAGLNKFMKSLQDLKLTVDLAIENFGENVLFAKVDADDISIAEYHKILTMIFHQVYESSSTFALAGVNCTTRFQNVKDYLFHHAEEEKSHWRWVLNDLQNTGYEGEDVLNSIPSISCQNYIAFNYYTALKMPVARLAIAAVLEGIGARFGALYARKTCQILKLAPEQAQFYFGHGDTDVEHIKAIWEVVEASDLTEKEWRWMCHAAKTAGILYRAMYDEAAKN